MMKVSTRYEALLGEHFELRDRIASLREHLATLDRQVRPGATQRWASGIAEDLVRLHEGLIEHFGNEEESGFFEELALEFPEHSGELDALAAEHSALLAKGRQIVARFLEYAETGAGSASELASQALALLERLLKHEQAETSLMQRSYTEDLGTP